MSQILVELLDDPPNGWGLFIYSLIICTGKTTVLSQSDFLDEKKRKGDYNSSRVLNANYCFKL